MNIFFGFLTLLICISCGKNDNFLVVSSSKNIDSRLDKYIQRFVYEASAYNKQIDLSKLTVQFDASLQGTDTLGNCLHVKNQPKYGQKININPDLFNFSYYSIANHEEVIFHEMGHCFLEREHLDITVLTTDGYHIYASIMDEGAGNDNNYENNRDAFIYELFTGVINPDKYTLIPADNKKSEFPTDYYNAP